MQLLSLIIPAYNEVESIPRTLREAIEYFESRRIAFEIIVCADGKDGTREAARELAILSRRENEIKVFGSVERRGKGSGIRLERVSETPGEISSASWMPTTRHPSRNSTRCCRFLTLAMRW